MTAHLSDSDRQALRLAHELREEMRLALPQQVAAPSVSPYVDPSGRPSVLLRMDEETARAMMALLMARRAEFGQPHAANGAHVPPGAAPGFGGPGHQQPAPPPQGFASAPAGAPEFPAAAPEYQGGPGYAPSHHTGPVPALPTPFPSH